MEHAGFVLGGAITKHSAENGHGGQIAAEHDERSGEYGSETAKQIQHHIAHAQQGQGRQNGEGKAPPIIHFAIEEGEGRRQHDGRGKDQHIVVHVEGLGVVEDQVGHENLNGDAEQSVGQKGQVELAVGTDYRGSEAVEEVGKILGICAGVHLGLVDEEKAQQAQHQHDGADGAEKDGPVVIPALVQEHGSAEHHQNGQHGHHGVDSLRRAPVGLVRGVGEPGVEGGVVGAGAKEGHDAVQSDHQRNAQTGCHGSGAYQRLQDVHAQKGKGPDAHAPAQIAAADKELPLAQFIRQGANEQGGHCGGHRAGTHHQGDGLGGGVKFVVDKNVQVHVLHDPGHLAHQTENDQRQPEFAVFLHRIAS